MQDDMGRGRAGVRWLGAAALVLAAGPVFGHAFPQRHDLPLPLAHYVVGAGAAVAASFLAAALAMRPGGRRGGRVHLPLPRRLARAARIGGGALGVAALALLLAAGLFGEQRDWARNPLPVFVWVYFWVGLVTVCALGGNLWALVNPWAALGRLAAWMRGGARGMARGGGAAPVAGAPHVWPAVALFFCFVWAELVWPHSAQPGALARLIVIYSALTFAAMAVFGTERWLRQGEIFAVVLALYARLAPVGAVPGGLEIRLPGAALARGPAPDASMTALILLLLSVVSFDGFSETPLWSDIAGAGVGLLYRTGFVGQWGYTAAGAAVKTAGLAAGWLIFAALYLLTLRLVARLEGAATGETARAYAPTLLPIAVGYHVAHYFSYLVIQGQRALPLASDPFGRGWDVFGAAGRGIDMGAVNMEFVWLVALLGIVLGHVIAVIAAHARALSRLPDPRRAARAQLPLVILMTLYTMSSLWIMAQPIVDH